LISFIIPAHNEERLLGATLDALIASARTLDEPFEVIVVDDASTDRTAEIAATRGARVLSVSLRQISAVRNAGARASLGDRLIFVDADTVVNEAVVGAAVRAMREGAVGGGALVRWDGRIPLWARPMAIVTMWGMRVGRFAAGCFMFCTRAAFERVGGFDERLYVTEEITLSRALRRIGSFVILRESVTTSARKLRTHTFLELLRAGGSLATRGVAWRRDRRHLGVWYGERRDE